MSISRIVNEKKLNEALKRINIPEYSSSDANKVLSVNSTGDTLLWADTNGTLTSESFENDSIFFVGNMDTNITRDGLVLWLYKDIIQDRMLYDLSGNDKFEKSLSHNGSLFLSIAYLHIFEKKSIIKSSKNSGPLLYSVPYGTIN